MDMRQTGFGAGALMPQTIEAYARLMGFRPHPLEVRTLLRLDRAFRSVANRNLDSETSQTPAPKHTVSSRPMTEALFDSLFP